MTIKKYVIPIAVSIAIVISTEQTFAGEELEKWILGKAPIDLILDVSDSPMAKAQLAGLLAFLILGYLPLMKPVLFSFEHKDIHQIATHLIFQSINVIIYRHKYSGNDP